MGEGADVEIAVHTTTDQADHKLAETNKKVENIEKTSKKGASGLKDLLKAGVIGGAVGGAIGSAVANNPVVGGVMDILQNLIGAALLPAIMALLPILQALEPLLETLSPVLAALAEAITFVLVPVLNALADILNPGGKTKTTGANLLEMAAGVQDDEKNGKAGSALKWLIDNAGSAPGVGPLLAAGEYGLGAWADSKGIKLGSDARGDGGFHAPMLPPGYQSRSTQSQSNSMWDSGMMGPLSPAQQAATRGTGMT